METIFPVILFIFGTLIGSFLNVVILRLPEGLTLSGRSHCPTCGYTLAFYDLIPVVSFIILGGRCRKCKSKISSRYFIIELVTGLSFALVAISIPSLMTLGLITLIKFLLATVFLIVIFVIDFEHFLILDKVLVFGAVFMLVFNLAFDFVSGNSIISLNSLFISGIIAGLLASTAFYLIWFVSSGKWMGFGDVKLVFLLGLITTGPYILVTLFLAFFLGTLVALPLLALKKKELTSAVPFGTFLSASTFITMLYGKNLLDGYLALIGWR